MFRLKNICNVLSDSGVNLLIIALFLLFEQLVVVLVKTKELPHHFPARFNVINARACIEIGEMANTELRDP